MKHVPLHPQTSPWVEEGTPVWLTQLLAQGGDTSLSPTLHRRGVWDGWLIAIVCQEPQGWHLSVSHYYGDNDKRTRYPTWDEQVHAVRSLLPHDLTYASFIPPEEEYVAVDMTTFHWHEHPEREVPDAGSLHV